MLPFHGTCKKFCPSSSSNAPTIASSLLCKSKRKAFAVNLNSSQGNCLSNRVGSLWVLTETWPEHDNSDGGPNSKWEMWMNYLDSNNMLKSPLPICDRLFILQIFRVPGPCIDNYFISLPHHTFVLVSSTRPPEWATIYAALRSGHFRTEQNEKWFLGPFHFFLFNGVSEWIAHSASASDFGIRPVTS